MAIANSIGKKIEELTIDSISGDSFLQLNINGSTKFKIGIDDSDSDKFKISSGSALGTSDCLKIASTGEVNKPLVPCFSVETASQSNVTGDGTVAAIAYSTEVFDQNNDFASSTFTAPVSGRYVFLQLTALGGISNLEHDCGQLRIVTSNDLFISFLDIAMCRNYSGYYSWQNMLLLELDAGDTVTTAVYATTDGGTGSKTIDVDSNSLFGGCLLC